MSNSQINNQHQPQRVPLKANTLVGDYRIERELNDGQGGFGLLYSAHKRGWNSNKEYVIKEFYSPIHHQRCDDGLQLKPINSESCLVEMFKKEQEIYQQLDECSHIPKCYEHIEMYGNLYFVMEYVNAPKVREQAVNMTKEDLLLMIEQVGKALQYCHELFILHLDISPNNILFCKNRSGGNNFSKLIDFGNAIQFTEQQVLGDELVNKPLAHTKDYADPCWLNESQIRFRPQHDLYGLAKVVELITNDSEHMNSDEKAFFKPFIAACTDDKIERRPCTVTEAQKLLDPPSVDTYDTTPTISYDRKTDKFTIKTSENTVTADRIRPFRYGYAAVFHQDKWAFINTRGYLVTNYEYDSVTDVFHGYVNVCKKNVWQTIRLTNGKVEIL